MTSMAVAMQLALTPARTRGRERRMRTALLAGG